MAPIQRTIGTVLYTVYGLQTYNESMLLNYIVSYSINSRVDKCFNHIYVLLVKPADSVFVYNTQRCTLVV